MEGAGIYQIAKTCRECGDDREMLRGAHQAAINVMRPKKNKRGKKAIQSTQALPQPLDGNGTDI
jgi:hypothetical protein